METVMAMMRLALLAMTLVFFWGCSSMNDDQRLNARTVTSADGQKYRSNEFFDRNFAQYIIQDNNAPSGPTPTLGILAVYLSQLALYDKKAPLEPVDMEKLRNGIMRFENLVKGGGNSVFKTSAVSAEFELLLNAKTWRRLLDGVVLNDENIERVKKLRRKQKPVQMIAEGEFHGSKERSAVIGGSEDLVVPPIISDKLIVSSILLPQGRNAEVLDIESIKYAQYLLQRHGFGNLTFDGYIGPKTTSAIMEFQKITNLRVDGRLTRSTYEMLLNVTRVAEQTHGLDQPTVTILMDFYKSQPGATLNQAGAQQPITTQTTTIVAIGPSPEAVRKARLVIPKAPVYDNMAAGDDVYAIESIECKSSAKGWMLLYWGTIQETTNDGEATVALRKRYGFFFDPSKTGNSRNNWWCVPARRYCWSEVPFGDWEGQYQPNETVSFETNRVFPNDIGLLVGAANALRETCGQ